MGKRIIEIPRVAILIGTNRSWGWEIVNGILDYAHAVGPWNIWIKPEGVEVYEELPADWVGDGVIARVTSPRLAAELAKSGLPVVNVADNYPEGFSAPSVLADDSVGTRMAAEYLVGRAHRNIAFSGPSNRVTPVKYRALFIKALSDLGRSCSVFSYDEEEGDLEARLIPWLESLPKPVGILGCGVVLSQRIMECCMKVGISVPHDVSVLASRDDPLICNTCFPPLSGVLAPGYQIGYTAAKKLHTILLGECVREESVYIAPQGIKERLSTEHLAVEDSRMIQVIEFLRTHACEQITMKDVEKAVPMSRRSLERRFQQVFGRTVLSEITRLRIEKARSLLVDTDLPMQLIAEKCGYSSYNYLSGVFKKNTGQTLRDYRNEAGAQNKLMLRI